MSPSSPLQYIKPVQQQLSFQLLVGSRQTGQLFPTPFRTSQIQHQAVQCSPATSRNIRLDQVISQVLATVLRHHTRLQRLQFRSQAIRTLLNTRSAVPPSHRSLLAATRAQGLLAFRPVLWLSLARHPQASVRASFPLSARHRRRKAHIQVLFLRLRARHRCRPHQTHQSPQAQPLAQAPPRAHVLRHRPPILRARLQMVPSTLLLANVSGQQIFLLYFAGAQGQTTSMSVMASYVLTKLQRLKPA